jgi:hypothetical protein
VKFLAAELISAAPRHVSAWAFQAETPDNKIAAVATRVSMVVRIAFSSEIRRPEICRSSRYGFQALGH